MATPTAIKARSTRKRLDRCWDLDLTWSTYPSVLEEVIPYIDT